ncbi:MAG: hypothetical protein J0I80_16530 [Sphingomonas sp.]|nr:hypothetical protein [Sphingomonas sp.]
MTAHFNLRAPAPHAAPLPVPDECSLEPLDREAGLIAAVRLFEQGETAPALRAVEALLAEHPDWVEGHLVMAQLLSQSGEPEAFREFLSWTIRRARGDLALVVACLRQLSDAEQHGAILQLVPDVRRWAGDHLFFTLLEAVAASELGDLTRAEGLFQAAAKAGGVLSLPHVRHLIRTGDAVKAATVAEGFVRDQPRHQGGWGLLETAWRLVGDTRHAWLVGQPGLVETVDVDLSTEALNALAVCLRRLHGARSHPFDQSLRGGTQTAGRLFHHDDIEIQGARRALRAAVRRYLDALPPHDPRHPLLGCDRAGFHVSDSWSVRLLDGGFHVSHVHPQGTLSSAFYVTLPPLGDQSHHAGWLTIGEPPETLRTGLPPLRVIEPKVGRLALFPSFLWHGTRPFPQGERMTVAFDTVLDG